MNKEIITNNQGISMVVLFIIGSAIVLNPGGSLKQDAWIAVLISIFLAVPAIFVYSRILSIFPEKELFEILRGLFGNVFSKIIILLFVWYSFHLGALVLRNFSEFIVTVSLQETPQVIIIAPLGILCIKLAKGGFELMGRWAGYIFPFLLIAILAQIALSMTEAEFSSLKPLLYNGIQPVINGAYSVFTFPFAETVIFTMIFSSIKNKFNTYKVYYTGILIGGVLLVMATLRNILVLGAEAASMQYFPSYEAVSVINIANFLQRIEVIVATIFIIAGIIKITACLFAASKGFAYMLNIKNYRSVVVPVAFLMMNLSCFVYKSIMEMFEWATDIYKYYAIPFQIILPLLIWICAEIKHKKMKMQKVSL